MKTTAIPPAKEIDRFGRAEGADPVVDRDGGKFGAGIIRGVSLASVGEALGHEMWLDQVTIDQITEHANATGETGLKCRFTHPGLSSDGMGRHLGRLFNVRTEGEKSIGDLHLAKSSHDTPDGDLAEYVMMLTEEDPKAAGLSIVFHHDFDAEQEFIDQNLEEYDHEFSKSLTQRRQRFKSPDERNANSYQHVRIAELRASDIVDEPAANPDGLFDRSPLARQADEFLSYAAGITEKKPTANAFDIDGDRANQFFQRWLSSHGLKLSQTEEPTEMADDNAPETPANVPVTRESLLAEQKRFTDKFGAEDGVRWFSEGKTFEQSLELFCEKQDAELNRVKSELSEANEKLSSVQLGETEPVDTNPGDENKKVPFAQYVKAGRN